MQGLESQNTKVWRPVALLRDNESVRKRETLAHEVYLD